MIRRRLSLCLMFALALLGASAPAASAALAPTLEPSVAGRLNRDQLGQLVFADEFQQPPDFYHETINPDGRWKTTFRSGWQSNVGSVEAVTSRRTLTPNKEAQCYTDPWFGPSPFQWKPGFLGIVAQPLKGFAPCGDLAYSSGLITTEKSFAQRWGYWEMKGQLPEGAGLWSAFWLLVTDARAPDWPPELDVMEAHGDKPRTLFTTTHGLDAKGKYQKCSKATDRLVMTEKPVAYGAWWDREKIVFYENDVEVARCPTPKGFDRPMHLLINLAVGGEWPGYPKPTNRWPAIMWIDHVRVYAPK